MGKQIYVKRINGNYSASPGTADGKLYSTREEKDTLSVQARPKFEILKKKPRSHACRATPEIADTLFVVQTQHFVFGIGKVELP